MVPGARIELARGKASRDFKSRMSTYSITRAKVEHFFIGTQLLRVFSHNCLKSQAVEKALYPTESASFWTRRSMTPWQRQTVAAIIFFSTERALPKVSQSWRAV